MFIFPKFYLDNGSPDGFSLTLPGKVCDGIIEEKILLVLVNQIFWQKHPKPLGSEKLQAKLIELADGGTKFVVLILENKYRSPFLRYIEYYPEVRIVNEKELRGFLLEEQDFSLNIPSELFNIEGESGDEGILKLYFDKE